MSQVFISYSRDAGISEQTAVTLHQQLTQSNISAFRDVESLDPGSHWVDVIQQQIISSKVMIVVLTEHALDMKRWVFREVIFASEHNIPIIPLKVAEMDIPIWLTHINVMDFTQNQDWQRLLATVRKIIAPEDTSNDSAMAQPQVDFTPTPNVAASSASVSNTLADKKRENLQARWDRLTRKINLLQEQFDNETRIEERLRLEPILDNAIKDRESLEREMTVL